MNTQIRFNLNAGPEVRDSDKRIITYVISDPTEDRHGTVLDMKGWVLDNYKLNGIVGYQHDVYGSCGGSDPDKVIGKGHVYIEGKGEDRKLMGDVEFEPKEINELAEKIYQKSLFGTLKATSVGFLPLEPGKFVTVKVEGEKDRDVFHYGKRELLEFSIVNIPSNPNAIKRTFEIEEENITKGKQEEHQEKKKEKNTEEKPADQKNFQKSLQLQKQLISLCEHSL